MTEHPERRGYHELHSDDMGRVSLRHVRPDDSRFREACDHLIGEGTDCHTMDRLDRIEQQARTWAAEQGEVVDVAFRSLDRMLEPWPGARMATWPGGIGEIPEG